MARATGDKARQIGFSCQAAATNTAEAIVTNAAASRAVIAPRGNSRLAVRGFSASSRASASRLKPIAALRAATIATRIHTPTPHVSGVRRAASKAPASANGRAKTE